MSDKFKISVIYIIFTVGIVGHLSGYLKGYMINMTPYVLIFTGILVLTFSGVFQERKFILWFLISYFITLLLEIAGVKTGLIFGEYSYGETLGYGIAGVPLIIGFNWIFVILGAIGIGMKISNNKTVIATIAGFTALIFDFILEPAAIKLNYWSWIEGEIPVQNYAAWFIITFLFALSFIFINAKVRKDFFIHYLTAQFLFFLILNYS